MIPQTTFWKPVGMARTETESQDTGSIEVYHSNQHNYNSTSQTQQKQRCWFGCWCCCPVEWTNWKELRKKSMMEFEGIFWTVSTFAEWTPVKSQQRIWRKKEEEGVEGMHIIMNNNSSSTNNKKHDHCDDGDDDREDQKKTS